MVNELEFMQKNWKELSNWYLKMRFLSISWFLVFYFSVFFWSRRNFHHFLSFRGRWTRERTPPKVWPRERKIRAEAKDRSRRFLPQPLRVLKANLLLQNHQLQYLQHSSHLGKFISNFNRIMYKHWSFVKITAIIFT